VKVRAFKIGGAFLAVLILLAAFLLIRAVMMESKQADVEATSYKANDGAAERLAEAVRFKTVSNEDPSKMEMGEFRRFNDFLVDAYPNVHASLERETVDPCSLIYTWKGTKPDLKPALMLSHTDVVPVEEDQLEKWEHGPYSGDIADGWIWGRGTLDDKVGVLGLLEAAEVLVAKGHKPKRTIVFAFGCDEEVGGRVGAQKMAKLFADRGIEFEFAYDEGLAIVEGIVPGISNPVALIGLVEKGFATYTLTVDTEGGHSSMPPRHSAIGILGEGLAKLENNQMPTRLNPATRKMFEYVGPHMPFGMKIVFANLWLLQPVLVSQLAAQPSTNAAVRTTTAVTIMRAGVQDNVLPKKATAKVNFRLAPGDTMKDVKQHIVDAVDDERIEVSDPAGNFASEASEISSDDTEGFRAIRDSIRAAFGNEVVVAPASTTGGTDARHYQDVSKDQYRFAPLILKKENKDTERIHGTNERVGVENYRKAIAFYAEFLARL
jgi:carboxypeptidase PM20D1